MFKLVSLALGAAVVIAGALPALAQQNSGAAASTGHVEANGISYYYEIHGEGEPLLLLHGGLGSINMFAPIMPILSENRQVIGIDLHGHGRTELGERAINLPDIGDDLALVIAELGFDEVDVLGYSFGAGAAFRLAVQHPETVRRLALVSMGFAQDGFYPEMLPMQAQVGAGMADMMKDTPMYQSYAAVAPKPEDFPRLLDSMGAWMRTPFDWSGDVATLDMPVMLVFGDSDMFRLEHVVEFYKLLGGGQKDAGWMRENMAQNRLAILPDLTHYEIFMAPQMVSTVLPFLDGESNAPVWTGNGSAQN